jgi:predicted nucleotide-binding protein
MARFYIIEDDQFVAQLWTERLALRGHSVALITSSEQAWEKLDEISEADCVLLDVMMPVPPGMSQSLAEGGLATGVVIAKELLKRRVSLRLILASNVPPEELKATMANHPNVAVLSKADWPPEALVDYLDQTVNAPVTPRPPRSFIVHGHDEVAKFALKNFIQNTLSWPEPIILHERPSHGMAIIEKFEKYAGEAQFVFVLMTPDDRVATIRQRNTEKRRARQNVIFEMGYFLGALGRRSGRVLLLHKGPTELPSDLYGIVYIDITKGIEAAGELIRREVQHAH